MPKRTAVVPERELEGLYSFREGDVAGWLQKHPYVVPLLIKGHEQALRIFGPCTEFELTVVDDPEAPNFRQLFARIVTDLNGDEAADRLEQFDNEWWLTASPASRGKLVFDTAFR